MTRENKGVKVGILSLSLWNSGGYKTNYDLVLVWPRGRKPFLQYLFTFTKVEVQVPLEQVSWLSLNNLLFQKTQALVICWLSYRHWFRSLSLYSREAITKELGTRCSRVCCLSPSTQYTHYWLFTYSANHSLKRNIENPTWQSYNGWRYIC